MALQLIFYISFYFHAIIPIFAILNNIEEIPKVKKLISDVNGHINMIKLSVLRILVLLIFLLPIFFIDDVFYFTLIFGSTVDPFVGMFLPVS